MVLWLPGLFYFSMRLPVFIQQMADGGGTGILFADVVGSHQSQIHFLYAGCLCTSFCKCGAGIRFMPRTRTLPRFLDFADNGIVFTENLVTLTNVVMDAGI